MKRLMWGALALVAVLLVGVVVSAAAVKTYQVTGPVLELRPDAIVVQKGTEKWELARDANTKVSGDLAVGSKVTIMYRMTAADITVAPAAGKAAAKKADKTADKKK